MTNAIQTQNEQTTNLQIINKNKTLACFLLPIKNKVLLHFRTLTIIGALVPSTVQYQ